LELSAPGLYGARNDKGKSDARRFDFTLRSAPAMIKSALVTGAGGGLGRAVTLALASRGCAVVALDMNGAAAEETAACSGAGLITPLILDLTAPGAAELAVAESIDALGGLDIVVNNAGWGIGEAFLAMTEASWDRTLDLNLKAVALICAASGRHMKTRGSGRIVNVTSPASRMALPNYLAYAASKAGVDAVTRAAAVALAPFGIRVNSVAPGMMDTAMQQVTERQLATIEGRDDIDAFLTERTRRIPIGRRTDVETVAGMIVWLALDAPDYLTAERLNISGGLDKD
jgi:3-oxoacyl-[acyl-carrier protein] reductase